MIKKRSGYFAITVLLLSAQVSFGQVRPVSPGGKDDESKSSTLVRQSGRNTRSSSPGAAETPAIKAGSAQSGLSGSNAPRSSNASARRTASSRPASRPIILPPDSDTYVAVVDNRFLKKSEMDQRVTQMLLMTDKVGWEDQEARSKMRGKIETMVLQEWAELTLLAEHALQTGLTASPAEVEGKMNEVYEEERRTPQVSRALSAIGISREQLREYVHDAILAEKLIEQSVRPHMQEKDLKNFYQISPGMFATPPRVELNYMAMRFGEETTVEENRRLKGQMENWRKKAAKKGKFLEVAKDFDEPELGQAGGYYGWATARSLPCATKTAGKGSSGRMVRENDNEIVEAVFKLKKGEVSNVLACERGFYVFQLINTQKASGTEYTEAKPRVESTIYELAKDKLLQKIAPMHTIYMNTNGINFRTIAEAKLDKDDFMKLREEQRKQKFMEHFRERMLQAASQPQKAIVEREPTQSPADIPAASLEILRKHAASRPGVLAAP